VGVIVTNSAMAADQSKVYSHERRREPDTYANNYIRKRIIRVATSSGDMDYNDIRCCAISSTECFHTDMHHRRQTRNGDGNTNIPTVVPVQPTGCLVSFTGGTIECNLSQPSAMEQLLD
jgi:hypothetical protein